jgi:isoquinoline 1-oxidoreductase
MTIEPDRLELFEPLPYRFEVARRDFFRLVGTGLVVAWAVGDSHAQESGVGRGSADDLPRDVGAWLHIAGDGAVTAYTGKTEVGQNIRTSLTQAVAEELRVPIQSVSLVMADTQRTPYDAGTFGSRTTPIMNLQLRRVASTARRMLIELASDRLGVEPGTLEARAGAVSHAATGRTLTYGELAHDRQLMHVVEEGPLTPAAEWKELGRPAAKINGVDFVTGRHEYTSDLKRPSMLYGSVLRRPSNSAVLISVDTRSAESLPSVRVVKDGDFVGVTAPTRRDTARAIESMRAEWKESPEPSSADVFDYFRRVPQPVPERGSVPPHVVGSTADALETADIVTSGTYTIAYIAHAPLEPRAALAEWNDGNLTVWTGSQRPFGIREELAETFHVPLDRVRVIVPDTGSAYGGKHTGEAAIEAARLARAVGKPVKVAWTRKEEFACAYFRPGGAIDVKSGVRRDGVITAWEYDNYNAGPAAIRPIYSFTTQRVVLHPTRSPLRVGSYRGLAATANHFARETHLDEVAVAVSVDPLELRRRNLTDLRQIAVLDTVAARAGWRERRKENDTGLGIACGFEKGSYVAAVASVAAEADGMVKVHRLVVAFECGAIVNPDGLRNQVEGAVVQGLGGALFEQIEFEQARVTNGRFAQYPVPRFSDIPEIEIILLDRRDLPAAGAGETPIVVVAPAIGNAIFAATGKRLRHMPLVPGGRIARRT